MQTGRAIDAARFQRDTGTEYGEERRTRTEEVRQWATLSTNTSGISSTYMAVLSEAGVGLDRTAKFPGVVMLAGEVISLQLRAPFSVIDTHHAETRVPAQFLNANGR